MSLVKLSYDRRFQISMISLGCQNLGFIKTIAEVIKPSMFEDEVLGFFYRLVRDYYLDYGKLITSTVVRNEVRKALKSKQFSKREQPQVKAIRKLLFKEVDEEEYVIKETITWARRQSIKDAFIEGASLLKNNDFDGIEEVLKSAQQVGIDHNELGTSYFEDFPDRISRRQREWNTIPTSIIELDSKLRGGGLKYGHMGIWLAPSKRGKTMALMHMAKSAVLRRLNCIVYSLEMTEDDVADRFDSTWANLTFDQLDNDLEKLYRKLSTMKRKYGNPLILKHYPPKTATLGTIRTHLRLCQSSGIEPDMVVVDYGSLLKSEHRYKEKRHTIGSLYEGLSGVSKEFNCCLWTAAQTNRGALNKEIVTMDDIGESFEPIQCADLVVALCQTKQEKQNDKMRLFIAANRHGVQEVSVKIRTRFATSTFATKRGI